MNERVKLSLRQDKSVLAKKHSGCLCRREDPSKLTKSTATTQIMMTIIGLPLLVAALKPGHIRGYKRDREAKQLRDKNTRLRKPVADLSLDRETLQSVIRKKRMEHRSLEGGCRARRQRGASRSRLGHA